MTARLVPLLVLALWAPVGAFAAGIAAEADPAAAAASAPVAGAIAPTATPAPAAAPAAVPAAAPATPIAAATDPVAATTTAPVLRPSVQPPAPAVGSGPSAGNLLQTIFALCAVLALMAGLAWFLKRYGPKHSANSAHLRIVGALNLGGRERIMVVEVGDQWIVVGASPGRVNALATLPRQKDAHTPAVLDSYAPSASSFSEWLKQTIEKRK
jgi:flagellar protein FliO/FliZ